MEYPSKLVLGMPGGVFVTPYIVIVARHVSWPQFDSTVVVVQAVRNGLRHHPVLQEPVHSIQSLIREEALGGCYHQIA